MHAICGWMGRVADDHASDRILDSMLLACGASPAGQAARVCSASGHLGSVAGEALIYCDPEIGVALSDPVYASSDSESPLGAADVAQLYREHGENLPARLHGIFAVTVLDLRERRVLLAVDRAGVRPLYFARIGESIAFASRLGALSSFPGLDRRIGDQALFELLYFHVIPSPGTLYSGVSKLLPAQALRLDVRGSQAHFYWRMPYRDHNSAGLADLSREFRDLLPKVVGRAAEAPGAVFDPSAVGCFLSGGTDSSTVAGTLRLLRGVPVRTYSMGFETEGFDEIEYARIAARHFETDPREHYVQPRDVVDAIPRIVAYCDEPFANASIVPAYLCARYARADGTVRLLAGDGGDEIFGGNARYANQQIFEIYSYLPGWLRTAAFDPLAALSRSWPVLRKLGSYVDQARVPLPDRLESYNFLHRTPLAEIFDPDFLARVDPEAPLRAQRECYGRAGSAAIVNKMMHLDLKITLADNDLRKVTQACELAGVDVQYPLLDERMMELAASIPPRLQLKDNRLRWFFKHALADFLPPEIVAKKKHGFGLPVGQWMATNDALRELTEDSLTGIEQRGFLKPSYIEWLRAQHRGQHPGYFGVMLWVLVMLEQWLRRHGH